MGFELTWPNAGAGLTAAVLAIVQSMLAWRRFRPSRLVGDETEYSREIGQWQPHAHWIRTPGLRCTNLGLAVLTGRSVASSGQLTSVLSSALAVGLATAVAATLGGMIAAAATALPLLLSTERVMLSIHRWPDPLLSAQLMALVTFLITKEPLLAGAALAYAVWTRIDAAGWSFVIIISACIQPTIDWQAVDWMLLLGPTLGVVAAMTVWNGIRRATWLPDTTMMFNLRVLKIDNANNGLSISDLMRAAAQPETFKFVSGSNRPKSALLSRIRILFGPETFVTDNLFAANAARYHTTPNRYERLNVEWGFSIVAFLAVCLSYGSPAPLVSGLVIVSVILIAVNTRSRYRAALAPSFALVVGLGVARLAHGDMTMGEILIGLTAATFLALTVILAPARREVPRD